MTPKSKSKRKPTQNRLPKPKRKPGQGGVPERNREPGQRQTQKHGRAKQAEHETVIVGGGLVGSLLALYFAGHGREVAVYEKRADIRRAGAEGGRSINLVLTRRGIRALERVGLADEALALSVPVRGRMMHSVEGELAYQPYGRDDTECNYSISRAGLNEFLVRRAADRGVTLRFDARLEAADPARGRLTFADTAAASAGDRPAASAAAPAETFDVVAERAFGADGAASALRHALVERRIVDERVEMLGHGYKELTIPAGPEGAYRIERHALHIWPRGESMLMALPNRDGSFTVTLYMPRGGEAGFDAIDTPERVRGLFERLFPDAVPLIPDLETAFLDNPVGELGTVRCRPWQAHGRVLLIGDAAHAIVPFFGQGMNTGFEDCRVLDELLAAGDADDAAAFAEFERRRKPDADAIADMALENFDEMRVHVGDPRFLLRKAVEHRLEREMPELYRSRYSMVMYSHIPFAVCREAGRIQAGILDELCRGLRDADDLDRERAEGLVRARLAPFLAERGVSLKY